MATGLWLNTAASCCCERMRSAWVSSAPALSQNFTTARAGASWNAKNVKDLPDNKPSPSRLRGSITPPCSATSNKADGSSVADKPGNSVNKG